MWEVTEENRELLRSWASACTNPERCSLADALVKKSPPVVDFEEVNEVLQHFSAEYPVYQFIERLHPVRVKPEKKRDRAYEARIQKLKKQQEDGMYKEMVRSIDPNQQYGRVSLMHNFGAEMRIANRQAIAVFNTLITVGGAFGFGFFGMGYAYPSLQTDLPFRLAVGIVLATIVFFADLYFIVKSMDDPGEKPIKAINRTFFHRIGMGYAYPSLQTDLPFRLAVGIVLATIVFFADLYFIVKSMDDPGEKPIKGAKAAPVKFDLRLAPNGTSSGDNDEKQAGKRVSTKKRKAVLSSDQGEDAKDRGAEEEPVLSSATIIHAAKQLLQGAKAAPVKFDLRLAPNGTSSGDNDEKQAGKRVSTKKRKAVLSKGEDAKDRGAEEEPVLSSATIIHAAKQLLQGAKAAPVKFDLRLAPNGTSSGDNDEKQAGKRVSTKKRKAVLSSDRKSS
ncbi:Transmembrane protein [Toxocara canis]|uniref:Transmembrane protein n=1 Tax=Toxocara canis TaxID=6265 RepID=A0A0B2W154_TOXCA|nr:Transmembrane protein [Toxocara canis]